MTTRCCLTTPEPGPWRAGVDDAADPRMAAAMRGIRDRLSHRMPVGELVWALRAAVQVDGRTTLGGDVQRCLLSCAAHRLEILAEGVDPAPWRTMRDRVRDAWAVVTRRAVCVYVR